MLSEQISGLQSTSRLVEQVEQTSRLQTTSTKLVSDTKACPKATYVWFQSHACVAKESFLNLCYLNTIVTVVAAGDSWVQLSIWIHDMGCNLTGKEFRSFGRIFLSFTVETEYLLGNIQ